MTTQSWLWPDRTIGKRESRQLREEHNALVNEHAAMRDALRELSEAVKPTREGKRDGGTFGRLSMADDNARAILATVEGEQ